MSNDINLLNKINTVFKDNFSSIFKQYMHKNLTDFKQLESNYINVGDFWNFNTIETIFYKLFHFFDENEQLQILKKIDLNLKNKDKNTYSAIIFSNYDGALSQEVIKYIFSNSDLNLKNNFHENIVTHFNELRISAGKQSLFVNLNEENSHILINNIDFSKWMEIEIYYLFKDISIFEIEDNLKISINDKIIIYNNLKHFSIESLHYHIPYFSEFLDKKNYFETKNMLDTKIIVPNEKEPKINLQKI